MHSVFRHLLACACLTAAAMTVAPATAAAAEANRIIAVVNDDVVSLVDLEMRTRMTLMSAGLQDGPEVRRRIVPQILRKLIEERLQLQEAERLKISVTDEEIRSGLAQVARQNRMDPEKLASTLAAAGVPVSVLERQIKADYAWAKVMRMSMLPRIKIGEDEVQDRLDRLREAVGRPEFLLAEIVLGVDSPDNEAEVARLAERILEQLKQGIPFQSLARQFSESASAARGGDLDWVPSNALDPEVAELVSRMPPGSVSDPIRTIDGYQILLLRDRRIFGQQTTAAQSTAPATGSVALAQALIPAGDDRAAARRLAEEIAGSVKNCAEMEAVAKRHGLPQSGRLGTLEMKDLPDALRTLVAQLDLLQASQPVADEAGFRVFMVCGRSGTEPARASEEPEIRLPDAEQVRAQLERERLELMAQRVLRELRRAAFVEVRL